MSDKSKMDAFITSELKEDGSYVVQVSGINFCNVNVYDDKFGTFCVSAQGKEIPKTAKIIWCKARKEVGNE